MILTRITKLPDHDRVLVGRDFTDVFEAGHVYGFKKYLGEILVIDLGITALSNQSCDYPNSSSSIEAIMLSSQYLLTSGGINDE